MLKTSLAACLLSAFTFAQTTPVVRLQNLAHTTDSLDKTVPFYRDVLGLPVNGTRDPLAQQPQKLDDDMSKFTATKGMSFRAATFRIPNATFAFELKRCLRNHLFQAAAALLTLRRRLVGHLLNYFNLVTAFLTTEFVNRHL